MAIKINEPNHEEVIEVRLSREKTPIAFKEKLDELMEEGAFNTKEEATEWIENNTFIMEMYYEKGQGLFLVESEAIDNCDIVSPYTKEKLIEE